MYTEKIKGAYRKLKSTIFYGDNLFYKEMVADFEENDEKMIQTFVKINEFLNNADVDYNNTYFNDLCDKISFDILPKKFSEPKGDDLVISTLNCNNIEVSEINFFINAPIELFIIDTLWTLEFITINKSNLSDMQEFSYGNRIDFYKLFKEGATEWNTESTHMFKRYYFDYKDWRDKTFNFVKINIKEKRSIALLNLDITRYYYNVDFKFETLNVEDGTTCNKLTFYIKKIYMKYKEVIKEIADLKFDNCIFPIGLISSRVLSNVYLEKFDKHMQKHTGHIHYARYVDDIYIAIPHEKKNNNKKDLISELNSIYNIFNNESEFSLYRYPNLNINKEKMGVYHFDSNNRKNVLIELLNVKIQSRVSDQGLFIDHVPTKATIITEFFKKSSDSSRFSDLKDNSMDEYSISIYLTKLISFYKNTTDIEKRKNVSNVIFDFFNDMASIKYHKQWKKIFQLLYLLDGKYCQNFYDINIKYIDELNKVSTIPDSIKVDLKRYLRIAYDLVLCYKITSKSPKEIKQTLKFVKSLMIDNKLVVQPLILLSDKWNDTNLFTLGYISSFSISSKRTEFSPYFISHEQFALHYSMNKIINDEQINLDEQINDNLTLNKLSRDMMYCKDDTFSHKERFINHKFSLDDNEFDLINMLFQPRQITEGIDEEREEYDERFIKNYFNSINFSNYNIGVVSICLKSDFIKVSSNQTNYKKYSFKRDVLSILNEAIKNKVNHLLFPELSIPFEWLQDLMYFSKRHNITITAGLQYFYIDKEDGKCVKNCVATLIPTTLLGIYRHCFLTIREKRSYPYNEKLYIEEQNYKCANSKTKYPIINYKGIKYSNMLCFEFTNICDRALFKGRINNLFLPVFNKDTQYFSSIVNSTSRDLYCFVSMSNTSVYGDSRVTAPTSSVTKDVVRVNGGENSYLAVASIDINNYNDNISNNDILNKNRYDSKQNKNEKKVNFKPLPAGDISFDELLENFDDF